MVTVVFRPLPLTLLTKYPRYTELPNYCKSVRRSNLSLSDTRMGCEVHRFAKLRSKTVHRTVFPSFVLPLTPHAPILLEIPNTPHAMTGNPAPIMALTQPPDTLCLRTISVHLSRPDFQIIQNVHNVSFHGLFDTSLTNYPDCIKNVADVYNKPVFSYLFLH